MASTYGLNKDKHHKQSYFTDCLLGDDPNGYGYHIYTENDNGKWIVFAEDHEPSDFSSSYGESEYPENGFGTLKDAAIFIWEFVDFFYNCWQENNKPD